MSIRVDRVVDDHHHSVHVWHNGRLVDLTPAQAADLAKHLLDATEAPDYCRCGHRNAWCGDLCSFCYRAAERITERPA